MSAPELKALAEKAAQTFPNGTAPAIVLELIAEIARLTELEQQQDTDIRVLKAALAEEGGFTRYERARAEAAEREVDRLTKELDAALDDGEGWQSDLCLLKLPGAWG